MAREALGERVLAVTALSPTYLQAEAEEAGHIARRLKIPHRFIESDELLIPGFAENPPDRCYHCKAALFRALADLAAREGYAFVADGSNRDDESDYRPGSRAAAEFRVRSPLREAGLTKAEIRLLSRERGLPTWDKPAMACLASRFPYGERITAGKLERVGKAEAVLRECGFLQVRVRSHGDIARIEVDPASIEKLTTAGTRERILAALKGLGFAYVALDLEGYRTGSMNEVLKGRS
jgi:uncharacterized protein